MFSYYVYKLIYNKFKIKKLDQFNDLASVVARAGVEPAIIGVGALYVNLYTISHVFLYSFKDLNLNCHGISVDS